jgi:hypothetical protein
MRLWIRLVLLGFVGTVLTSGCAKAPPTLAPNTHPPSQSNVPVVKDKVMPKQPGLPEAPQAPQKKQQ